MLTFGHVTRPGIKRGEMCCQLQSTLNISLLQYSTLHLHLHGPFQAFLLRDRRIAATGRQNMPLTRPRLHLEHSSDLLQHAGEEVYGRANRMWHSFTDWVFKDNILEVAVGLMYVNLLLGPRSPMAIQTADRRERRTRIY